MAAQTLTVSKVLCDFIVAPEEPIFADSRDYGFDFVEEELACEWPATPSASLAASFLPEVGADEFERIFHFFLS